MSITTLKELFLKIKNEYLPAKQQPFTNHPLAQLIRDSPGQIISQIISGEDLTIKGSAGMGNWSSIPWIAIFNKNETDGAQEGVYVCYLFSENLNKVYLTLNQGVTKPIEADGRRLAFQKLKAKAIDVRTNYSLQGFSADDNIQLASSGMGSNYEKATIFYKEYNLSSLPDEVELVNDLKKIVFFYNNYLLDSNVLTAGTDFQSYVGEVEEGKRILKKHYVRERNPKVIKEAKRIALERTGILKCEVCEFIFKNHYGERAIDFIEGHHKKAVSEMVEGNTTSPEDIALLCSNCHRVIHLKMPWLSLEELRTIYH